MARGRSVHGRTSNGQHPTDEQGLKMGSWWAGPGGRDARLGRTAQGERGLVSFVLFYSYLCFLFSFISLIVYNFTKSKTHT